MTIWCEHAHSGTNGMRWSTPQIILSKTRVSYLSDEVVDTSYRSQVRLFVD